MLQHMRGHDEIEALILIRQGLHTSLAKTGLNASICEAAICLHQHSTGQIDAIKLKRCLTNMRKRKGQSPRAQTAV